MKQLCIFMLAGLMFLPFCSKEKEGGPGDMPMVGNAAVNEKEVLVSSGFEDDDTFVIICKGKAMSGLNDVAAKESAKRAALMNAYYFARKEFGDDFSPDKEGVLDSFEFKNDVGIIKYVIKKEGLRDLGQKEK